MRYSLLLLTAFLLVISATAKIEFKTINEKTYLVHFQADAVEISNSSDFTSVFMENSSYPVEPGAPNLPFLELHIAVPPNAGIELNIINRQLETTFLSKPVEPVQTIIPEGKTHRFLSLVNKDKYDSQRQDFLEKSELQSLRHTPYYTIRVNPFLYEHSASQLQSVSSLTFEVKIIGETDYFLTLNDPYSSTLDAFFSNPIQAEKWKYIKPVTHAKIPFESSQFWYKVKLNSSFQQKISLDKLAILPDFIQPSQLQLIALMMNEEGNFDVFNIPLQAKQDGIYFAFPASLTLPHQAWLTIGASTEGKTFSEQPFHKNTEYEEVKSLQLYTTSEPKKDEYDCILIAPQVFLAQAQELADFYQSFHGLSSLVADQQTIVDTYVDGTANPVAIKNYIQDIYNDNPALQHVILVGSGTEKGHISINLQEWYSLTPKNKIMPYNSVDDRYVMMDGSNFPAVPISRIPAKTVNDLAFYLTRAKEYTEFPNLGWWKNKLMLVADDENKGGGYEGFNVGNTIHGLNHSALMEQMSLQIHEKVEVEKVFAFHYEMNEFNQKPGVTQKIIDTVNEGVLTWVYIGHGNHDVMGDEDYFIGTQHSRYFENEDKLNLMIAASCNVSEYTSDSFDSIGEQFLFLEKGGSIATIGASQSCSGSSNSLLTTKILTNLYNNYYLPGYALWNAKLTSSASITNSNWYHYFGDPLLPINPPNHSGSVTITKPNNAEVLQARQTVLAEGDFSLSTPILSQEGDIRVYDTAILRTYNNYNYTYQDTLFYTVQYWEQGHIFFRGAMEVSQNIYDFGFIVPDDIHNGNRGKILNYVQRDNSHYVTSLLSLKYDKSPLPVQSTDSPQVTIWVDSEQFQPGDYVSTNPIIIANIADENGINISGEPGRKILIHLDKSNSEEDLYDASEHFVYNLGSFTEGVLQYQLKNIETGYHTLDLYVYDNFGEFAISSTHFYAQKTGKIAIKELLPYPNPMAKGGKFTFVITEAADVTLQIFTITGKKIKTIQDYGLPANYNEIDWNGKDEDGDALANGTYFYKVKATSLQNSKTTEKTGKFIVYK